jgi:serine/threonine protein kinase
MYKEFDTGDVMADRWHILRKLVGGMGEVLIVFDRSHEVLLAAKSFRQDVFKFAPDLSDRFVKEARVWLDLDRHENLVEAHFIEIIGGRPFLFLEYISGGSLSERILTSPSSILAREFLPLAIDLCDGMIFATSRGLVAHRDLKPANCLVTEDGILKITDFGLAMGYLAPSPQRPAGSITDSRNNSDSGRLSKTGHFMGTPAYMAPEQFIDFRGADLRADIYSFGIMLFELSTGRLPYPVSSAEEFQRLHSNAPIPSIGQGWSTPREIRDLNKVIQRCLQKDPDSRFLDFVEVRGELVEIYERLSGEIVLPPMSGKELDARKHNNKAASFGKLGMWDRELIEAEKALTLDPEYAAALLNRGAALMALSRHQEALTSFDHALAINPNIAMLWSNKGICLEHDGRLQDALRCHERAVTLDPKLSHAWVNKATTLILLGRDKEALQCCITSLEFNPHSVATLSNLGFLLARAGQFEAAVASCDHALALNQKFAQAWYVKGLALVALNQQDEAFTCLKTAELLGISVDWSKMQQ